MEKADDGFDERGDRLFELERQPFMAAVGQ